MNLLKNIRKIFEGKPNYNQTNCEITYGEYCPKCKDHGSLFNYKSCYDTRYESFYRCENCNKRFNNKEYSHLITLEQRKLKLQKLNENR